MTKKYVDVEININRRTYRQLLSLASTNNVTFNDYCVNILKEAKDKDFESIVEVIKKNEY